MERTDSTTAVWATRTFLVEADVNASDLGFDIMNATVIMRLYRRKMRSETQR